MPRRRFTFWVALAMLLVLPFGSAGSVALACAAEAGCSTVPAGCGHGAAAEQASLHGQDCCSEPAAQTGCGPANCDDCRLEAAADLAAAAWAIAPLAHPALPAAPFAAVDLTPSTPLQVVAADLTPLRLTELSPHGSRGPPSAN